MVMKNRMALEDVGFKRVADAYSVWGGNQCRQPAVVWIGGRDLAEWKFSQTNSRSRERLGANCGEGGGGGG